MIPADNAGGLNMFKHTKRIKKPTERELMIVDSLIDRVRPHTVDDPIVCSDLMDGIRTDGFWTNERMIRKVAAWLRSRTHPIPVLYRSSKPAGYYYPRPNHPEDYIPFMIDISGRIHHIAVQCRKMKRLYEIAGGKQKDMFVL